MKHNISTRDVDEKDIKFHRSRMLLENSIRTETEAISKFLNGIVPGEKLHFF